MANICSNRFYFACEQNEEKWSKVINDFVSLHWGEIDFVDDYGDDGLCFEGYFDSRWNFPMSEIEEFIPEMEGNPDGLYMRCLSEEYGTNYVAMNIYRNGKWLQEQTFDF